MLVDRSHCDDYPGVIRHLYVDHLVLVDLYVDYPCALISHLCVCSPLHVGITTITCVSVALHIYSGIHTNGIMLNEELLFTNFSCLSLPFMHIVINYHI